MQKKLALIVLLSTSLLLGGGCSTQRGVWAEVDDVYVNASDRAEDAARREPSSPPAEFGSAPTPGPADPDETTPATRSARQQQPNRNTPGSRALDFLLSGVLQLLISLALLLLLYL
jgi:hypothetical protein